ncbi:MAG: hypothetical protein ABIG61_09545 [Planctomycetota bacterium]
MPKGVYPGKMRQGGCLLFVVSARPTVGVGFLFFAMLLSALSVSCAAQQNRTQTETLFSPYNAQTFYQMSQELYTAPDANRAGADQAIVFLMACQQLDERAKYFLSDVINITSRYPKQEYFKMIYGILSDYLADAAVDLYTVRLGVQYLLEQFDSREQREALLRDLAAKTAEKNPILSSELTTQLALLEAEKANFEAARNLLGRAYNANNYNNLAFEKLLELAPETITAKLYAKHLRLALAANPMDINAAVAFARYAENLEIYDLAARAYEYAADLFGYLNPSESLPRWIYLPWAVSSYNTTRSQQKCIQIAKSVRQSGLFDLFVESIAAKAAKATGNEDQAAEIFTSIEKMGSERISQPAGDRLGVAELAWFYCFVKEQPDSALAWANRAYSDDPNDQFVAAILAYALAVGQQWELAKPLLENIQTDEQVAMLAKALVLFGDNQRDSAIETLRSVISSGAGTLEAHKARQLLADHGSDYISPVDPDKIWFVLKQEFGSHLIPNFVAPQEMVSYRLVFSGTEFPYGVEIPAQLVIKNLSADSMIIGDLGLIKGNLRVDAHVRGDFDVRIPQLIQKRFEPSELIKPDQAFVLPLRLSRGDLGRILARHPQASLEIEFTVYLDPVEFGDGTIANTVSDLKPFSAVIKRQAISLSPRYLQNRINSLATGQQPQKVTAVRLLAGLLWEQQSVQAGKASYSIKYAEPAWLISALKQSLGDNSWTVKVQTMVSLWDYPSDYTLVSGISSNLDDAEWPVRLTALFVLAKSQGPNFQKVLDWTARYDSSEIVRGMAVALGAQTPEPQRQQKAETQKEGASGSPE